MTTITTTRLAVILACAAWYSLFSLHQSPSSALSPAITAAALFTIIILLGVGEKLSSTGTTIALERDWLVILAGPAGHDYDLTRLNAAMRRIDLVCKLLAPIVISAVAEWCGMRTAVLVVGGMGAGGWGVEVWCVKRVWGGEKRLRVRRRGSDSSGWEPRDEGMTSRMQSFFKRYADGFRLFFSTTVWMPSMALSLLHLSVLSYSATFITYLLSMGVSLNLITIARAAGSVIEISSTVFTPVGVKYLGKAWVQGRHMRGTDAGVDERESERMLAVEDVVLEETTKRTETGLERLGLWGITWQLLNLASHPFIYCLRSPS